MKHWILEITLTYLYHNHLSLRALSFLLCWQCLAVRLFLSLTDMWQHVIYNVLKKIIGEQRGQMGERQGNSAYIMLAIAPLVDLLLQWHKVCWFDSPPYYIMKIFEKQCDRLLQPLRNTNKQQIENKWMNPSEQSVRTKRWGGRLDWETEDLLFPDEHYLAAFCTGWDIVCLCSLERQLTLF